MPTNAQFAPQIEQFIHDNPQGVLTSFRRNGMPQLSIVTVYPRDGGVGISITETRMKFKNLLRDPRCSVLVSHADWWSGFLVFEGRAELTHSGNTDPEKAPPGSPAHLSVGNLKALEPLHPHSPTACAPLLPSTPPPCAGSPLEPWAQHA